MAKRSGKFGKVLIRVDDIGSTDEYGTTVSTTGFVELAVKSWSVEHTVPSLEITQTTNGGFYDGIDGIAKLTGDVECVWDSSQSPVASGSPAILPGTTVYAKFYVNRNDASPAYDVPNFYIEKGGPTAAVDGVVTYKASGNANGPFTVNGV